jgi:hypothetical protein
VLASARPCYSRGSADLAPRYVETSTVITSEPAWLIDLSRKAFTPAELYPEDIVWHKSVFAGYGEGITDRGGPVALSELKRLYEVDKIHALAKQDPNYFFNTPASVWAYTGRVGKAPDFIGFFPT